jgi:hypothetical protein
MKLKTSITPSLFACFAAATSLNGKWTGKLLTANSKAYPLTYNFTLLGDSLVGMVKARLGSSLSKRANRIQPGCTLK